MIQLQITLANGASASCHILTTILSRRPFDLVCLTVQSFTSTEAYMAGSPYVMTDNHNMPAEALVGAPEQAALAWLVAPSGPFAGGEIMTDQSGSLEAAQDRAWERMKRARTAAEESDFTVDGHVYQANKLNVAGAALAAKIVSDSGGDTTFKFTLSDDSSIMLTAAEMMGVGLALTAKVEAVHERGRQKRVAIYSATNITELDAITWYSEEK